MTNEIPNPSALVRRSASVGVQLRDKRAAAALRARQADREGYDDPAVARFAYNALQALRYRFWIILVSMALFAVVAMALALLQDPYYRASAAISIDPRVSDGMNQRQAPTVLLADALVVDSEVEVIWSNSVLRKITNTDAFRSHVMETLGDEAALLSEAQIEAAGLQVLRSGLSVEREQRTFVIRLTFEGDDPDFVAQTVNAIANSYIASKTDANLQQAEQAGLWLQSQLDSLTEDILDAEARIAQFRLANNIPQEGAKGQIDQEIDANDSRIVDLRSQVAQASAEIDVIRQAIENLRAGVRLDYDYLSDTLGSTLLRALGNQLNEASSQGRSDSFNQQLLDLSITELETLRNERQSTVELARTEIESLLVYAQQLETSRTAMSAKQAQLTRLISSVDALRNQEQQLLERFEGTQRSDRYFVGAARLIEEALPPLLPSNPGKKSVLVVALLGGALVGAAVVFVLEQLSDVMRRSDDVIAALGAPYLGAIPQLNPSDLADIGLLYNEKTESRLTPNDRQQLTFMTYAARQHNSQLAETIRRIWFEVEQRDHTQTPVVSIVSPFRSDGKSFLAANMAFYLASIGKSVLLVDGDVHKTSLTRDLLPLLDVLPGSEMIRTIYRDLDFYVTDSDSATYRRDRVSTLLDMIRTKEHGYEVVILDTPALGYVNDALEYSNDVTDVVSVFQWGKVSANVARRIMRANPDLADKLIGSCLTLAPFMASKRFEGIPAENYYIVD